VGLTVVQLVGWSSTRVSHCLIILAAPAADDVFHLPACDRLRHGLTAAADHFPVPLHLQNGPKSHSFICRNFIKY